MCEVCVGCGCVGIEMGVIGIEVYLASLRGVVCCSGDGVVFSGGRRGLCRVTLMAAVEFPDRWQR